MWIFMSDYLSRCTLQSAFHHLKCDYMVRWDLHIVTLKCETFCAAELSSVHTVTGPHCIIQIAYKLSRLALVENWPFDNMFTICSFKMNQVHILFFPIIPFSSSLHKSEVDYNITVNSIFALNNINLFKTFFPLLAYVSDFTALYSACVHLKLVPKSWQDIEVPLYLREKIHFAHPLSSLLLSECERPSVSFWNQIRKTSKVCCLGSCMLVPSMKIIIWENKKRTRLSSG